MLSRTHNATIEVIIEGSGFNNSLAGDRNCPNARKVRSGLEDATIWIERYLQNGTLHLVTRETTWACRSHGAPSY